MTAKPKKDQKQNSDAEKFEKEKEKLENKVLELETRLLEMENNWKRALADYQNLQKRTIEEKSLFSEFSTSTIIRRVLPVMDNLEMLNKHMNDEGIKMIVKDFKQTLEEEGVKEIEAEGKNFDVAIMEAVETIDGEKDKVLEVVQKGYLYKNKLLRPARVRVGKG